MTPAQKVHTLFGWEYDTTNEAGEGDYSSDFLLGKLPAIRLETWHNDHVVAKWHKDGVVAKREARGEYCVAEGDTPCQALQLLAIELYEKKVL